MESLKPWYGRKAIRGAAFVAVVAVAALFIFGSSDTADEAVSETQKPVVQLTTAGEYLGGESISLIGDVRSFTEAAITTERAGRVTGVNVTLGQQVSAGQVLATLENASERASVLQAEGVYEAALAAAAQSDVGVDEAQNALRNAQNNAVTTFQSAYNTSNATVKNTIDPFFTDPNSRTAPGLRLDGRGYTAFVNSERIAYQDLLPAWQVKTNTISSDSDLDLELQYAREITQRTIELVDAFIAIMSDQDSSDRYSDSELQGFRANLTGQRASLIGTQNSIDVALTNLASARDTIRRADISASGSSNSAADAQVKQALGSLRAAQANLAKTILRTPISGTVNSIDIRTGDFINSFAQIAEVANNNALEIVTYVGDKERSLLSVGDEVSIEGGFTGIISEIAPAVDTQTRKTEVRIAAEGIDVQNGDTVNVTKEIGSSTNTDVIIPLSAVKFQLEDGVVFLVEDGKLVARDVELGVVRGGSVTVLNGLSSADRFVVDARGLLEGAEVEIAE